MEGPPREKVKKGSGLEFGNSVDGIFLKITKFKT